MKIRVESEISTLSSRLAAVCGCLLFILTPDSCLLTPFKKCQKLSNPVLLA